MNLLTHAYIYIYIYIYISLCRHYFYAGIVCFWLVWIQNLTYTNNPSEDNQLIWSKVLENRTWVIPVSTAPQYKETSKKAWEKT